MPETRWLSRGGRRLPALGPSLDGEGSVHVGRLVVAGDVASRGVGAGRELDEIAWPTRKINLRRARVG